MWQDMLSPSLESLYDRQQTANRAGDSALSARRVLRPGSSLSSSSVGHTAAAAGHRVHRERESKDMLNDTLLWLKQRRDGKPDSRETAYDDEEEQLESFCVFNPSRNQGIPPPSSTISSRPGVKGKRYDVRKSVDSDSASASTAGSGGHDRPASAPAPVGGGPFRETRVAGDIDRAREDPEGDTTPHFKSIKRSWRSFSAGRAIGGSASRRADPEQHDSGTSNKPPRAAWSSFFGSRGNSGSDTKAAATKVNPSKRRNGLPLSRGRRRRVGSERWHMARGDEKRSLSVSRDVGCREPRGVSTPSTISTISASTISTRYSANARPDVAASPDVPHVKQKPRPPPAAVASAAAGVARWKKKESGGESKEDEGAAVPPSPTGADRSSVRRQSSRIWRSKFDQLVQYASRNSIDRDRENPRRRRGKSHDRGSSSSNGGNRAGTAGARRLSVRLKDREDPRRGKSHDHGDSISGVDHVAPAKAGQHSVRSEGLENRPGRSRNSGSSNGGKRAASAEAGASRLSVKLEGLENRRGRSRESGSGNGGKRAASAEASRKSDDLKGPENHQGRSTRERSSSSNGAKRAASATAASPSRSSRSPPIAAATKAEAGGGGSNGAANAAAAGPPMLQRHDYVRVVGSMDSPSSSDSQADPAPSTLEALVRSSPKKATATAAARLRKASGSAPTPREPAAAAMSRGSRASPLTPLVVVVAAAAACKTNHENEKARAVYSGGTGVISLTISAALDAAIAAGSDGPECTDQATNVAADAKSDDAPLLSGPDSNGRPVDAQGQQHAVPAEAARPLLRRDAAAARSMFWRQSTGSLEREKDFLFRLDQPAYTHAPDSRGMRPSSTMGHAEGEAEEPRATGAEAGEVPKRATDDATRRENRAAEEPKAPPHRLPPKWVWVAQHIDKSDRHGVAFLMSDGSVVMRFRDKTVMVSEPTPGPGRWEDGGALDYYVKGGKSKATRPPLNFIHEEGGSEAKKRQAREMTTTARGTGGGAHQTKRTRFTTRSVPPYLEKKMKLFGTLRKRLLALAANDDADGGGGDTRGTEEAPVHQSTWEPSVLVEVYRPTEHCCLFVLSDSTVQIAFSDGTKILLSGDGDLVTLIHADGEKEQETISFAKALEDERTDIIERVQYSKRLIHYLQEEERKAAGGGGGKASARTARTHAGGGQQREPHRQRKLKQ